MSAAYVPQSSPLDASGRLTSEWLQWLLNPKIQQLTLENAVGVDSGGTGLTEAPGNGQLLTGLNGAYTFVPTLPTAAFPALAGDITTLVGSLTTTLKTVNSNVGSFLNANITVDGKGRITAAANGGLPINAQTGTTYTVLLTDVGAHLTFSNAAAIAVTLPAATTSGFGNGFFFYAENIGVGAVTITPTTSTINALTSIFLDSGSSALIMSDGANYRALIIERNGVSVNAQTGTSYTFLTGDRGRLVTQTNASASAYTLPSATTAGFGANWFTYVQNRGPGALTITPATSTIDGASTLALATNQGCLLASDGTNYFTARGFTGISTSAVNVFTKNQSVSPTVVSSATGTYTADASTSNNFQLTLTGNLTLANPTNLTSGMMLNFTLDEDATGGRTITLGSLFKFPGGVVPTWVTTANARNFISGYYDGSVIRCIGGAGYA